MGVGVQRYKLGISKLKWEWESSITKLGTLNNKENNTGELNKINNNQISSCSSRTKASASTKAAVAITATYTTIITTAMTNFTHNN